MSRRAIPKTSQTSPEYNPFHIFTSIFLLLRYILQSPSVILVAAILHAHISPNLCFESAVLYKSGTIISSQVLTRSKNFLLFWNRNVHYRSRKIPPLNHVLRHMNPFHISTPCFSKFRFNIRPICAYISKVCSSAYVS
jgi:hypothetical protein